MNFLRNKEATCYTKFEKSRVSAGFVVNQFICSCYLRMINEWRNDNSVTELLLPSSVLSEVISILCKNNSMLPPTKRIAESMHVSLITYI